MDVRDLQSAVRGLPRSPHQQDHSNHHPPALNRSSAHLLEATDAVLSRYQSSGPRGRSPATPFGAHNVINDAGSVDPSRTLWYQPQPSPVQTDNRWWSEPVAESHRPIVTTIGTSPRGLTPPPPLPPRPGPPYVSSRSAQTDDGPGRKSVASATDMSLPPALHPSSDKSLVQACLDVLVEDSNQNRHKLVGHLVSLGLALHVDDPRILPPPPISSVCIGTQANDATIKPRRGHRVASTQTSSLHDGRLQLSEERAIEREMRLASLFHSRQEILVTHMQARHDVVLEMNDCILRTSDSAWRRHLLTIEALSLQKAAASALQKTEPLVDALSSARSEVAFLGDEVHRLRKALDESGQMVKEQDDVLEELLCQARELTDQRREDEETHRRELRQLRERLLDLEDANLGLTEQVNLLHQALDDTTANTEGRLAALGVALEGASATVNERDAAILALEESNAALGVTLQGTLDDIAELSGELAKLRQRPSTCDAGCGTETSPSTTTLAPTHSASAAAPAPSSVSLDGVNKSPSPIHPSAQAAGRQVVDEVRRVRFTPDVDSGAHGSNSAHLVTTADQRGSDPFAWPPPPAAQERQQPRSVPSSSPVLSVSASHRNPMSDVTQSWTTHANRQHYSSQLNAPSSSTLASSGKWGKGILKAPASGREIAHHIQTATTDSSDPPRHSSAELLWMLQVCDEALNSTPKT